MSKSLQTLLKVCNLEQFNSVNLILKMNPSFGQASSPGKIYKIKLFEKEIKVQLVYKSPPKFKKQSKNAVTSIILQRNKEKSISILADPSAPVSGDSRKKKGRRFGQRQKQFYVNQLSQTKNILEKFQNFHGLIAERKIQGRIKVYSNPKLLSLSQHQNINRKCIPDRKESIANNTKEVSVKKLMKIKLFASRKKGPICQKTPEKEIESQRKQQRQRQSEANNQTLTPSRGKKYKLEVTASKSRFKNDSIMSNHDFSKQISSIKHKSNQKQLLNSSQRLFIPENSLID